MPTVVTPSGEVWKIRATWAYRPRVRKFRPRFDWLEPEPGDFETRYPLGIRVFHVKSALLFYVIVAPIALVVGTVGYVLLPPLAFIGEALAVAAGGVLIGRQWRIRATSKTTGEQLTWLVRGWRRKREAVAKIADALRQGKRDIVL